MSRYIDADDLINDIENVLWDWDTVNGITATTVLKQTITDIKNQPTADVQEIKHGHWVRWYVVVEHDIGEEHIPHCKCSECEEEFEPHATRFMKYCSYCGAKMDEEAE